MTGSARVPTVLYLRGWNQTSDPGAAYLERETTAARLRSFAIERGLAVVGLHEDTVASGARRPGLASLVRQVAAGRATAVLVLSGEHLSSVPAVSATLMGLIADLGAQVVVVDNELADEGQPDDASPPSR